MADVRLIIDPPLPGPWNMAVDEALLMDAVENSAATLRFYRWSEPTLSLGYFQHYAQRRRHAASRDCAIVRRQTGGGAIVHDRELTYSIAVPPSMAPARDASALYDSVHNAFIAALMSNVQENSRKISTSTFRLRGETALSHSPNEPFLCFQRASPGDVILQLRSGEAEAEPIPPNTQQTAAWKVLGSAQRRHRGAILQHGSLLLERSTAAPELPGLANLDAAISSGDHLITAICAHLSADFGPWPNPSKLPSRLQSKATELANTKYSSDTWTKRR